MNNLYKIIYILIISSSSVFAQTITYGLGTELVVGDSASVVAVNVDLDVQNGAQVQIDSKGQITVNSATGTGMIIESTSEGTGSLITNAPSDLNVEVHRYLNFITFGTAFGRIGNLSSPVQGATAGDLGGPAKSHLESQRAGGNDPYTPIDASTTLNVMEAYSVYHDVPEKTLNFTGQINGGDLIFPITSTQYNGTDYYGWNLIGNPYPSAISIDSIVADIASNPDLVQTVYYLDWTTSAWIAYNQSMGPALPYNISVIPVGQGFFVKKVDGTGNGVFTLKDQYRVHDNNNYLFDITSLESINQNPEFPPYYFELSAKNTANDNVDVARYRWRDDATTGFDNEFDSYKLDATGTEHPNIFFRTGSQRTAIQQEPTTESVAAGFSAPWTSNMEVNLTVDHVQTFSKIVVEDTKVSPHTFTDLTQTGAYYHFTQSDDDSNRFILHLTKDNLSNETVNEESYKLYSSEKSIIFISPKGLENAEMKIFDSLGRCVKTTTLRQGENKQEIKTELNTGVYIVKIVSQEFNTSESLLIE